MARVSARTLADLIESEEASIRKLHMLMKSERLFYNQRAKVKWGDTNSKLFHASIKMRKNAAGIGSIALEDGSIRTDRQGISDSLVHFFENLLGFATI